MKLALDTAKKMMDENGGSLDLRDTGITSLPEGLSVGGYLDLEGCTGITSLPEGLTVGGSLDLEGCTGITSLPEGLSVGGSLDLRDTGITSLPEGLSVGGYLDLEGCTGITSLPEGLSVGGSLDLRDTGITSLPEGTIVQGEIYGYVLGVARRLTQGEYVEGRCLYAEGILLPVKKKKEIQAGGATYTLYAGKIKNRNAVSDGVNFAHCKTFREGIADLKFKAAKDRGAKQYRGISLDKALTVPEAVTMYRIITGACRAGSEAFVASLGELKQTYTVREMIELTSGQYGHESLKRFFGQ